MIHYYRNGTATATAESEASAARLESEGFTRCSAAEHRQAWQERDRQTRLEREIPPPGWVAAQDVAVISREVQG